MTAHVINVIASFAVAYVSSAVYWLAQHGSKWWRVLSVTFIIAGFLAIAVIVTQWGTGVDTGWDWWIVLGWVIGWIAWALTKSELDLA